jgi:hypothetical protein
MPIAALAPERIVSRFADVPAAVIDLLGRQMGAERASRELTLRPPH